MSIVSTPLLLVGSLCSVVGSSAAVYLALAYPIRPLQRILADYEALLEHHTSFLMLEMRGAQILRLQLVASAVAFGFFMVLRHPAFIATLFVVALAPPWMLRRRHLARIAKLEGQLDAWLLMLANALKATSSVGEAIASTVTLAPRPFREEVDLLVKEMRLGVPLDRAVHSLACRIRSTIISGAFGTIVVARQTGGDLPQTLERASAALRESSRLEGMLRAKTAEGRGQVFVLAAVPFVLCIIIAWLDPSWFDPMLHHSLGRAILMGCSLAWAVAVSWAHYIVRAEL